MARSDIRNHAIDEDDFDETESEDYDDGLGEETDDEGEDPDPDAADFQGLMNMRDPGLLDLAARLLHNHK